MGAERLRSKRVELSLRVGVLIPFLYFGIQLLASFFYPGYSFFSQDASTLGGDGSSWPAVFNVGAVLVGLALLFVAWGHGVWGRMMKLNRPLLYASTGAMAAIALGSINAGLFPCPALITWVRWPRRFQSGCSSTRWCFPFSTGSSQVGRNCGGIW